MGVVMLMSCRGHLSAPAAVLRDTEANVRRRHPASEVYDVIAMSLYASSPRPQTVLIADSSLVFRQPGGSDVISSWRMRLESMPRALVAELARVSATRVPVEKLSLPTGARVITRAELRSIFTGGPPNWEEFYRRYPEQRMWFAVTPVVFNADTSQALLYREYHCGGLCGGGGFDLARSRLHGRVADPGKAGVLGVLAARLGQEGRPVGSGEC